MIRAAKLDFTVEKMPIFLADGTKIDGSYANVSSDTKQVFGIVGDRYEPLQPQEAFDFTDSLIKSDQMQYRTAGMLSTGKIWILAAPKTDRTIEIVKGDPIEIRHLFTTGFDGQSVTEYRGTSITVVCNNTLNIAESEKATSVVRIRHTNSQKDKLAIAAKIVAAHAEHQKSFVEALQFLAKKKLTNDLVTEFERRMFGSIDEREEGRGKTVLLNKLDQFEYLMVNGKGTEIPGRTGNAYGMLQAFTEWTDWMSQVKGTDDRTNSIVFGNGAKQKTQALSTLLELVTV
jgi:phage/plasmid-like protein (TIGR03299 family)